MIPRSGKHKYSGRNRGCDRFFCPIFFFRLLVKQNGV